MGEGVEENQEPPRKNRSLQSSKPSRNPTMKGRRPGGTTGVPEAGRRTMHRISLPSIVSFVCKESDSDFC
jgi:hypothetical protein